MAIDLRQELGAKKRKIAVCGNNIPEKFLILHPKTLNFKD
jgi:hypothetical protein